MHPFKHAYRTLEQVEERSLTHYDVAWALRVQPATVSRLIHADTRDIRPSYLLAMQYVVTVGLDGVDLLEWPGGKEIDELTSRIVLPLQRIAHLLGISERQLRNLRREDATEQVPFQHYLALLYLLLEYQTSEELQRLERHADKYAAV